MILFQISALYFYDLKLLLKMHESKKYWCSKYFSQSFHKTTKNVIKYGIIVIVVCKCIELNETQRAIWSWLLRSPYAKYGTLSNVKQRTVSNAQLLWNWHTEFDEIFTDFFYYTMPLYTSNFVLHLDATVIYGVSYMVFGQESWGISNWTKITVFLLSH